IGEKGAAKLIAEWGSLDDVLAHVDEIPQARVRNALREQADRARLSRELATLRRDVPLPVELSDLACCAPDRERLRALFRRLEFGRLLAELEGTPDAAAPPAAAHAAEPLEVGVEIVRDEAALAALLE